MDIHKKLFNRDFILLWQGMAFSAFGSILYSIAIGYWVFETTGSTALMGIISSITLFMMVFIGPITGAMTDRMHRRNVLVVTDLVRGLVFLLVGYLALTKELNVTLLVIVAIISGVCGAFFSPAAASLFPDLLPKDEVVRGQSIASGTDSLIRLVGSTASGSLIVMFGVPTMILINGVCYIGSAVSELFINAIRTENQTNKISVKMIILDMKEGAKFALTAPGLSTMMIAALIINLLASGFSTLMIAYVLSQGMDMIQYGVIAGSTSLGGLVGMFVISIFKIKTEDRYMVSMGTFIFSSICIVIGLLIGSYVALIIAFFIGQLSNAIGNALFNAAFIVYTPQKKRGMLSSFMGSAAIMGSATSALLYGFFGEIVSLKLLGIVGNSLAAIPFIFIIKDKQTKKIFNLK
ncbi:MAG: MFS transporter [Erysipelotrichaceae bacterium]|nr:MFS transporter [Erysipelotrichaceae bacterium]MDD3924158.1 MFS transporter [Erysipelotrichaceae bacterium]MDD4642405.1 MFS transporter [Erysipelotrichaceae bacterium]